MDDLIAFLRARLDDDEQTARPAEPGLNYLIGAVEYAYDKVELDQRHAIRHNPARVLAEVDAKRRILTAYENYDNDAPELDVPESVLRFLALPYASHPDYKDAWRP